MSISVFIKRYQLFIYYILTFTISWGGILFLVGPDGIPGTREEFETLYPVVILALLAGPSVASIIMTWLIDGGAGLRKLFSLALKWRVGIRWYFVALLASPLVFAVISFVLALLFPEFLPGIVTSNDKASLLILGIIAGLIGGFLEELGWTGFVLANLRQHYSVFITGIIMGVLWGAWHLLINFWSSGSSSGTLSMVLLLHSLFFSIGILPAFRMLMVCVYNHTESLLVATLMHMSLIISNILFVPSASGVHLITWSLVLAVALWIINAAVAVVNRSIFRHNSLCLR